MALTQVLRSRGPWACPRPALASLTCSASRAQPRRTIFGSVPESEILRKKLRSPKYIAKVVEAETQWDLQAEKIKKGEAKNMWDFLDERGFIKDVAGDHDVIRKLLRTRRIGAYVGIDPTASSLHLGHLVPLMPLFWMYLHGYKSFSLIGGSTARIGDPTGRLESRSPLPKADYVMNMAKIHFQLKTLWVNVEEQARKRGYQKQWAAKRGIINNNAWWNKQPLYEIMKRVGLYLRVGPMLSRDTVKRKMETGDGMSFAEFTYPVMQGWDWFELARQLDVQMQIGGSDQFGNILTGIEVFKAARDSDNDPASRLPRHSKLDDPVGFTVPLLTDSKGAKFGKTAGNAVWLDPYQTSVYDLYGYFVRRSDAEVERLLKLLTFLPLEEIQTIMADHAKDPSKRVAQHTLALEATTLIHGADKAEEAAEEHRLMYRKPAPVGEEQYQAVEGHPTTAINRPRIDMILPRSLVVGKSIGRVLHAAGLASSASDGHRLAAKEGAYIGGAPGQKRAMEPSALSFTPIKVWFAQETEKYLIDGEYLILRKGKHNLRIIKVVSDEEYEASGETYPGQPYTGVVRKMQAQLKELRAGTGSSKDIREALEEDQARETRNSEQILVFPEDKGRQRLEIEAKLADELRKLEESAEAEESTKTEAEEPTNSEESK